MALTKLKLPPQSATAATTKPPSGRALRARRGRVVPKAATVPEQAPRAPATATTATDAAAAKESRRRRPRSAPARSGDTAATAKAAPAQRHEPSAPARAPKVVFPRKTTTPELPRLSKRMGELGLCSRREADEWIERGWVKVDGSVVTALGTRVPFGAVIDIDPRAKRHQDDQVTILLHKPIGYVSGQAEDGHQPAIVLIRPENRWQQDRLPRQWQPGHLRNLAPAGRLDIDSTGLLVFTQDGRIARRLIGKDSEVEKEYLVRVEGALSAEGLGRLRHGLALDGEALRPAGVEWVNEHQLRFVLREGKKRQIRRMCELVGLVVVGLKRVRSGAVVLGPLPVGKWRYLGADEAF